MSDALPTWVYQLVMALEKERETHPPLFFTSGAFEGYVRYERCTCWPLDMVPVEVRVQARVIRDYLHSVKDNPPTSIAPRAGHRTEPGDSTQTSTEGGGEA